MPNRTEIQRVATLLEARPDLSVVDPLNTYLGQEPTLEQLTTAALALAQPQIMFP